MPTPFPGPGKLVRMGILRSRHISSRKVVVWLPPEYEEKRQNEGERYGVLYMHDGQNLYEPHTSFAGDTWGVPGTLARLIAEKRVRPTIVVGVWNTPARMSEYMPARALDYLHRHSHGQDILDRVDQPGLSEGYLRFLVEDLKPLVDLRFYTRPERHFTTIMGSSMGGLISLYAMCQYPEIYGGAGCLSTHWPAGDGAVIDYMDQALPHPHHHRIYFDYGTKTADAPYEPYQLRADDVLEAHGYRRNTDWMTLKFPGQDHSERAWAERLHRPLEFLLKPGESNSPLG